MVLLLAQVARYTYAGFQNLVGGGVTPSLHFFGPRPSFCAAKEGNIMWMYQKAYRNACYSGYINREFLQFIYQASFCKETSCFQLFVCCVYLFICFFSWLALFGIQDHYSILLAFFRWLKSLITVLSCMIISRIAWQPLLQTWLFSLVN